MLKIFVLTGIPASGKSTWAKEEVAKNPLHWVRINNDDLRAMVNNSIYSSKYEKNIADFRLFMIKNSLKNGLNIIVDNVNLNKDHWEAICNIARFSNQDVEVSEKLFYLPLEEAIARDSERKGSACVGEKVIRQWWKISGGENFKNRTPKTETFYKEKSTVKPLIQNENLEKCIICDLDGTLCDISHRNPYDASTCNKDTPNSHVLEMIQLYHKNGYKIFFFSGREESHKAMTMEWLNNQFGTDYSLHMRETGNKENDRTLKERFFNSFVKDKYNCRAWIDDRLRVCEMVHDAGLPLFRVGNPLNSF